MNDKKNAPVGVGFDTDYVFENGVLKYMTPEDDAGKPVHVETNSTKENPLNKIEKGVEPEFSLDLDLSAAAPSKEVPVINIDPYDEFDLDVEMANLKEVVVEKPRAQSEWAVDDDLDGLLKSCGHKLFHQEGSGKRQEQILGLLFEYQALSQRELLDILHVQPGTLSEILTKLENKGLIERQRSKADRRIMMIQLTDEGLSQAEGLTRETNQNLFQALTQEEQDTLNVLLKKLVDSWQK